MKTEMKKAEPQSYRPAPEVQQIAEELIAAHYEEIHKFQIPIRYFFVTKPEKKNGREAWGMCRLIGGLNALLANSQSDSGIERFFQGQEQPPSFLPVQFFVITISEKAWFGYLSEKQQRALVDHELSHVGIEITDEGEIKLSVTPHDIEEFSHIIYRHGAWARDVERARQALEAGPQMSFEEISGMDPMPALSTEVARIFKGETKHVRVSIRGQKQSEVGT